MIIILRRTKIMNDLDQEKVLAIYDESRKIVSKGLRAGQTKSEIANEIYKKIKEIVDNED